MASALHDCSSSPDQLEPVLSSMNLASAAVLSCFRCLLLLLLPLLNISSVAVAASALLGSLCFSMKCMWLRLLLLIISDRCCFSSSAWPLLVSEKDSCCGRFLSPKTAAVSALHTISISLCSSLLWMTRPSHASTERESVFTGHVPTESCCSASVTGAPRASREHVLDDPCFGCCGCAVRQSLLLRFQSDTARLLSWLTLAWASTLALCCDHHH